MDKLRFLLIKFKDIFNIEYSPGDVKFLVSKYIDQEMLRNELKEKSAFRELLK